MCLSSVASAIYEMAGGENLLSRPGDRSKELMRDEVRAADPDFSILACCGLDVDRTLERVRGLGVQ